MKKTTLPCRAFIMQPASHSCRNCGWHWDEHQPMHRPSRDLLPTVPEPTNRPSSPDYWEQRAATEGKATNPKDAIGDTKVPLWLLSPIAKIKWAMAQFSGLVKYGAWNWRAAGVRTSVYLSAMERHMEGFKSGEDLDPVDGTDHLGNVMACCAILIDAREAGLLTDDRPPSVSHRSALASAEALMADLKLKYADKNPRHYTIADTQQPLRDL